VLANSIPNAGADTGRSTTGPGPAALDSIKLAVSRAMRGPATALIRTCLRSRRNQSTKSLGQQDVHLSNKLVHGLSQGRWDSSAMVAGSHGHHVPVSIELGRNCRRSAADCESGKKSKGANTIGAHECPHWSQLHKRSPGDGGTPGEEPTMGRVIPSIAKVVR